MGESRKKGPLGRSDGEAKMMLEAAVRKRMIRDGLLSVAIYALPVALMFGALVLTGRRHLVVGLPLAASNSPSTRSAVENLLHRYWLPLFVLALGIVEFSMGLYE